MPKATYLKLPEEKKQRIYAACKTEFADKPFHQATVRNIVQSLEKIPRGSFYQYFEDFNEFVISMFCLKRQVSFTSFSFRCD